MWRTFPRRACDEATVWISRSIGRRWTDGKEPISSSASNDRRSFGSQALSSDSTSLRARGNRTTDGCQNGSGLIVLARHPSPDVRGTIAKDDPSAGFVLSQE